MLLALTVTGLELAKPWPITWVIDRLVALGAAGSAASGDGGGAAGVADIGLGPIIGFAFIAFAIPALLGLVTERLELTVARVSRKATVRIRSEVFEHLQRLELAEHQREYSGDLLTRVMGDVNMIRDLLFPSWLNVLSRVSILVGGSVAFALVDWRLFLVAVIPLPLLWVSVERGSSAIKGGGGQTTA